MAEETPAPAPKPKKSKKGLILAIVGVLVLGGAGGGYFALGSMKEDAPAAATKDKGKDKSKSKKVEEPKAPALFYALDPPFVVNFQPGSTSRFLQVAVQLMTRDPLVVEFLEHHSPIIRNDLLLLFGNKQVAEVSTQEGKEALRAATLEAVRKVISAEGGKPEAVEAVYFTSFVMQ